MQNTAIRLYQLPLHSVQLHFHTPNYFLRTYGSQPRMSNNDAVCCTTTTNVHVQVNRKTFHDLMFRGCGGGTGIKINQLSKQKSFTFHIPHVFVPWNKHTLPSTPPPSLPSLYLQTFWRPVCNGNVPEWSSGRSFDALMSVVVWNFVVCVFRLYVREDVYGWWMGGCLFLGTCRCGVWMVNDSCLFSWFLCLCHPYMS